MATITISQARAQLYRLVDEAAASHEPILITGKRANAVLISEADWQAITETLYLLGIPGCGNPSGKACKLLWRNVLKSSTGELAGCLHQAGPEGRQEINGGRATANAIAAHRNY